MFLVPENNHVGHEAECVEGSSVRSVVRGNLQRMRFHWFAQKLFAKKCLKGVPQNVSSEHFWELSEGRFEAKSGFWA